MIIEKLRYVSQQSVHLRPLQVVARLTADNLVFMAQLKAAEAAAAAAAAERDELRLALEQHKGPWMDEVRDTLCTADCAAASAAMAVTAFTCCAAVPSAPVWG
jgi:hypothetical protein